MWTGNPVPNDYSDTNPRNNSTNNPNGKDASSFNNNLSDGGGNYDTNMVSRVVQLSIDWENHLVKDYRVYEIPKMYSRTRGSVQMFDEGVMLISYADQSIVGLYDFNDSQTVVEGKLYKNGKELFKATISTYRANAYK